jgi:hypothetical protein
LTAQALTRLAQLYADVLPKVGVATAMDLGDPTSPFGSIHPRDKQTVGLRLSDAARALTYGIFSWSFFPKLSAKISRAELIFFVQFRLPVLFLI